MLKVLVTAAICGALFGLYAAFSAYMSGWPYDVWLLGFAVQGAFGAIWGLAMHVLGLAVLRFLGIAPVAAFVGGGVAIWFVSVVTSGVLQSRSFVIAEITIGLCIGACLGVIAWGVHVLVPNYAFKPTAEEAAQRIQAPSRGGGLT